MTDLRAAIEAALPGLTEDLRVPHPSGGASRPPIRISGGVLARTGRVMNVLPATGGYTPRPAPPPAAPKRDCSTCQAGHGDLNSAAHCAAAHAARSVAYAWVDAQPDPPDLPDTKQLLGRLTNQLGQPNAIKALEVVISLGWRPVDLDDDDGGE